MGSKYSSVHLLPSRLRVVQCVILVAFIVGCLLSPRLWISKDRIFPLLSPLDFMPSLAYPFDLILLLLFIMLLAVWIWHKNVVIGLVVMGMFVFILLQDQMRWQPWVYLYFLLLLPYVFQKDKKENVELLLLCLQYIIAGVYVWSGIHKCNPNFIDVIYDKMLKVSGINYESPVLNGLGYAIPCFEILVGVFLLISKCRNTGVIMAVIMHIVILIYLGPLTLYDNVIVYPWNVAMILFVVLIFWNTSISVSMMFKAIHFRHSACWAVLAIVWIMPAFNFVGHWDHYASFSLYSNKPVAFL